MKLYAIMITWEYLADDPNDYELDAGVVWVGSDWDTAHAALTNAMHEEAATLGMKYPITSNGRQRRILKGKTWGGRPVIITGRLQTVTSEQINIQLGGGQ